NGVGPICYTSPAWGIGGATTTQASDMDTADIFISLSTFVDIAVADNRRKFSDSADKPIDLGSHCEKPLGAAPNLCFTGALASWPMNKGTAGGFMLHGNGLDGATSNPAD